MNCYVASGVKGNPGLVGPNVVSSLFGFPDAISDDFEIGDVVSLIVGGPDMVVYSMCECGTVEVAWADSDGDIQVDVFPEEALVHVT